ncbi:MAG: retropepsin-like aspartic protease [Anaerolineales bacterium]|nr:MAG: retropepsin-like aspartic protease [Anaerolineales bacterium]
MPKYDTENFDPPAPVATVTLRHPATGVSLSDVPMLIDTGADVTLLPREFVERLGVETESEAYEVQSYNGETSFADAVKLEMVFLDRKFTGQFLLMDQPMGVLGRNVLNAVSIFLDGPDGMWEEQ